jgi:hypothetical protein
VRGGIPRHRCHAILRATGHPMGASPARLGPHRPGPHQRSPKPMTNLMGGARHPCPDHGPLIVWLRWLSRSYGAPRNTRGESWRGYVGASGWTAVAADFCRRPAAVRCVDGEDSPLAPSDCRRGGLASGARGARNRATGDMTSGCWHTTRRQRVIRRCARQSAHRSGLGPVSDPGQSPDTFGDGARGQRLRKLPCSPHVNQPRYWSLVSDPELPGHLRRSMSPAASRSAAASRRAVPASRSSRDSTTTTRVTLPSGKLRAGDKHFGTPRRAFRCRQRAGSRGPSPSSSLW